MSKWKEIGLGDVATFYNGYPFKPTDWSTSGKEIIRIQNLTKGSSQTNYFEGKLSNKYSVTKGDILISWSGSLGIYEWEKEDAWLNQHLFKVVFDKEEVDKSFFKYLISNSLEKLETQVHGATMKHITKKNFDAFPVNLPPLPQQQKIANILDAADALKQNDKALIAKYDELTQALFLDMFGDPVSNPKGWEKVKMDNLMTILRGGSPRPIDNYLGGKYPWIKIGDATKGDDIYLNSTRECITKDGLKKTRLLPKGSLIFANCGVSLGFARILTFEGCIHDGWLAFSNFNEEKLNKIFLLKALNSITQYFRDTAPDGTQPNLNIAIMKNFELIMPPISMQKKFETTLSLLLEQKAIAQKSLEKSESLFNSLLQKAFKGELV
jgi:type I restriction enzyme S subunit